MAFKGTVRVVERSAVTNAGERESRRRLGASMPGPELAPSGWPTSSPSPYLGGSLPTSRASNWLVRLAEVPLGSVLSGCLFMVAAVGWADYRSGQDVSLSIFYLIPALVAATKGRRLGLLVAATAAATGFVADSAGRATPYSSVAVPLWNSMVRLIVLVLVVALVDALLRSARHERQLARRDHLTGV